MVAASHRRVIAWAGLSIGGYRGVVAATTACRSGRRGDGEEEAKQSPPPPWGCEHHATEGTDRPPTLASGKPLYVGAPALHALSGAGCRQGGPRAHPELGVDAGEIGLDRLDVHEERLRHLLVGQPL